MKQFAVVLTTIGLILTGCKGQAGTSSPAHHQQAEPQVPTSRGQPIPANGIGSDELNGYWTGDWGQLVLVVDGADVRGAYSHDQGTLSGTYGADGVLRVWWCEVPSRSAPKDAGEAEFNFVRGESTIHLDGRWRYGTEGDWREDWDLAKADDTPAASITERFNDPSTFCEHP